MNLKYIHMRDTQQDRIKRLIELTTYQHKLIEKKESMIQYLLKLKDKKIKK